MPLVRTLVVFASLLSATPLFSQQVPPTEAIASEFGATQAEACAAATASVATAAAKLGTGLGAAVSGLSSGDCACKQWSGTGPQWQCQVRWAATMTPLPVAQQGG